MEATRRGFLRVTTGAISGLSLAGPTTRALGGVQQRIRQRKDVSQLNSSSPDIVALTTAVGKMKAGLGDGDRRNLGGAGADSRHLHRGVHPLPAWKLVFPALAPRLPLLLRG